MRDQGADYATPRRWLTPSNSKACRWRAVGVVTSRKPGRAGSAGWIWLRQMVPRSASRVAKLCTGRSSSVRLAAALARAFGERAAGAHVGHDRGAGDHPKIRDAGELSGQLVRHATGEVLLSRIAGKVFEWKDGERMDGMVSV